MRSSRPAGEGEETGEPTGQAIIIALSYIGETSASGDQMPTSRRAARAALDLPPGYRLVTLREVGDAFAHAVAIAPREGAGTLVYVGRFDLA